MRAVTTAAVVLLVARAARAEVPAFQTLDRQSPTSTVSLDASVVRTRDETAIGGDLWAHYVHSSGIGGYLAFPVTYVALDGPDQTALGNAEGGVLYAHALGEKLHVVAHAGVAYDYEHQGIAPVQYVAALARQGDLVQRWGFTTWLRFGASALGRDGHLFWRADGGVDLMLDDHEGMGLAIGPIARIGAGAGYSSGPYQFAVELVGMHTDAPTTIDRTIAMIAVSAAHRVGRWQPGFAVVAPVTQLALGLLVSVNVQAD
jgi:hypothetical protein